MTRMQRWKKNEKTETISSSHENFFFCAIFLYLTMP
uniref:Uncharacterized protein n=1 Tax=Arundo donax TaxID=35708 RepID=A0A0A9H2G9_ARUDO